MKQLKNDLYHKKPGELLSTVVNICPNCGTQRAYYRYEEKYWPWDRVERCMNCNLEWVCVGSKNGPGIAIVGVDEIGLRPLCPNCLDYMSFTSLVSWQCKNCNYTES